MAMTGEQRAVVADRIRQWHKRKQEERGANRDAPEWRPISFGELVRDIESGALDLEVNGDG
jgi:hypothetical protein